MIHAQNGPTQMKTKSRDVKGTWVHPKMLGTSIIFIAKKTAVRPIHFSRNPSEAIEASAKAPVGRVCFASPAVEGTPAE